MKNGDLIVGGNEAYMIVGRGKKGEVQVRLAAGKGIDLETSVVPQSFLDGRTIYRPISELTDVDATMAMAEVSKAVDVDKLGWNARLWVSAFTERYKPGKPVPDSTTLIGWFSRMIDAGYDRKEAELAEVKRSARAAKRKKVPAKNAPRTRTKK